MQKYATGLRTCRNMIVRRHGGVANRPGTLFGTEVADSLAPVRLLPFELSTDQAYVIELRGSHFRMLKGGAYLSLSAPASGWVFPFFYSKGETVSWLGINYVNISGTNPNTAPPAAPAVWYPLPGLIYELPTPYLVADLPEIRFAQRAHTLVLTHPSYEPRELLWSADTIWALNVLSFAPSIGIPGSPMSISGGSAGAILYWAVTAVLEGTFEEGVPLLGNAVNAVPSEATPTLISWDAASSPPDAAYFRVYRGTNDGDWGFIGQTSTTSFSDTGSISNPVEVPPQLGVLFQNVGEFPTAVTHYQQRLVLAGSRLEPETVWASRSARLTNFAVSFPLSDDDAVTFTMIGRKLNDVRHLLDLGRLIVFTQNEEKMVEGDEAGILRPDAINPRKLSANGIGTLRPIEVGDSAVYVQARGTKVRDFKPVSADSYEGNDLSVFAAHLFDGYTIVDWAYAQNPDSIIWAVRSDGVLLGLTYLREHAIWGWHRHDTDGVVENICVIPEGAEDRIYLVVRRTINGATKRYIERMASRFFTDQEDAIFMDSALSYDGWNAAATTVHLTGGANWDETELLTCTASAGIFSASDVGNQVIITLTDADGEETDRVVLTITSYTSATVVKGHADKTVPALLQTVRTTWALAKKTVTGLSHLEGKSVSVLGDGYVVASPNNSDPIAGYPEVVVTGGVATLPAPYAVIRVGLPYISDVVTLDLDLPGAQTIKDRKFLVNRLGIYVEASKGIWAGMPDQPTDDDPLHGLQEYKARSDESYSDPVAPKTDFIDINIQARWDQNGRIMVRQVDPLPLTVLSITPIGYL